MKKIALTCVLLIGCAGASAVNGSNPEELPPDTNPKPEASFIPIDSSFKVSPRTELSMVVLDEKELAKAPLFRAVGVLQLEGKETKRLSAFYEAVAEAGASVGCDVLYQRDAFELGNRVERLRTPASSVAFPGVGAYVAGTGRDWRRNDKVLWQFLCGVAGASEAEQERSLKVATNLAVTLRREKLGNVEPCEPFTPTGSHVRRNNVCTNDPHHRNVADSHYIPSYAH